MTAKLRVVIADDERPARSFLVAMLRDFDDVEIVGEAENGVEAVEVIERTKPDIALLDLQMPEVDGLGIVRLLRKNRMPLIAFVTAYDEYAVRAFELNAVDYLLKPVDRARLRETLNRAQERLELGDARETAIASVRAVVEGYESVSRPARLERIPIRKREEIIILPVNQIASIIAEGELLNITTAQNERYTITYRLKDLEARLDSSQFIRLGRGSLANLAMITRVSLMPGGTYVVVMSNGQQLNVSRLQSRFLREQLLRL
jgi:two-component system LytT family response regulator